MHFSRTHLFSFSLLGARNRLVHSIFDFWGEKGVACKQALWEGGCEGAPPTPTPRELAHRLFARTPTLLPPLPPGFLLAGWSDRERVCARSVSCECIFAFSKKHCALFQLWDSMQMRRLITIYQKFRDVCQIVGATT